MKLACLIAIWAAQDSSIYETKYKYEKALKAIDGVIDVSIGGVDGKMVLIVRVDGESARESVRAFTQRGLDGHPVHIMTSRRVEPKPAEEDAPAPEPKKARKEAPPEDRTTNFWKASVTDCDIVRQYLKMSKLNHPTGGGKLWINCALTLRKVNGPFGGHSYVYTKHRTDCPIRLGRVHQPDWADNYIAWIFQKGFCPVMKAGITWPDELPSGNDKGWSKQATEDLMTRINFIREGAEWVQTPGDRPGLGWTWKAPVTSGGKLQDTPTK